MNSSKKLMIFLFLLTAVLLLLIAGSAFGVENFNDFDKALVQQQQQQPEVQSNNLWSNFMKLILVLGLIIAAAWLIIKLFARQTGKKMQGTWLHIVDEVMIGQNRGIVLCELAGRIYALGVTDGQINKLFEVEDDLILEELKKGNNEANTETKTFLSGLLGGHIQKRINDRKKTGDFHELMQEQVNRMENISAKLNQEELGQKRSDLHE